MSFKCTQCPMIFEERSKYKTHRRIHSFLLRRKHSCQKCSYITDKPSRLKAHQIAAVLDPPTRCEHCDFTSCTSQGISYHRTHAHGPNAKKPWLKIAAKKKPTQIRPKVIIQFESSKKLDPSLKIRKIPKPLQKSPKKQPCEKIEATSEAVIFSCPYCEFKSPVPDEIRSHMTSHVGIKPYKCEACPFRTGTWKFLKKHVLLHSKVTEPQNEKKPTFTCKTCGKVYHHPDSFRRHYKTHVQKSTNISTANRLTRNAKLALAKSFQGNPDEGKILVDKFPCDICEFKAFSPMELTEHIRHLHKIQDEVHQKLRPKLQVRKIISVKRYKCDHCKYSATRRSYLISHLLIHSEAAKKHECSFCPYKTYRKYDLGKHEKIHLG